MDSESQGPRPLTAAAAPGFAGPVLSPGPLWDPGALARRLPPTCAPLPSEGRGWASRDAHTPEPVWSLSEESAFPFLRKGQGPMLWDPDLARICCFETTWNHKIGTNRKNLLFHPVHYALVKNMALVFRRKIKNRFGKNWGFLMFPLLA